MFKKLALSAAILALSVSSVQAAGVQKPISINVSAGNYDHRFSGSFNNNQLRGNTSDSATGFGIRGAYRATPGFAAELGYFNYGEADLANLKSEATAIQAGIKGIYPVSSVFEIYTRFGASVWDLDDSKESGTDFYFGIGGEAIIRNEILVGVSYNQFTADATDFNYRIGGVEVSLGYKF